VQVATASLVYCITRGGDNSAPVLVQDQGGRVAKVDTHLITTAVVLPIASRRVRFNPFRVLRALKEPGITEGALSVMGEEVQAEW